MIGTIVAVIRQIPSQLGNGINRWVLRMHSPIDIAGDGSGPAVCIRHGKPIPWPCSEFVDAADRMQTGD